MNLEQKQAAMRRRWEQIRPAISRPSVSRQSVSRYHSRGSPTFGTTPLDTVCELKQLGRLVKECTSPSTQHTFKVIVRVAEDRTGNDVLKNICKEILLGMGEKV